MGGRFDASSLTSESSSPLMEWWEGKCGTWLRRRSRLPRLPLEEKRKKGIKCLKMDVRRNTHQPKPKENVKFFIYNVDGQNANGIVGLHGAGWTVFEERTFSHSWKYLSHGINSCLRIILQETQCAYSVGAKMAQKVWNWFCYVRIKNPIIFSDHEL